MDGLGACTAACETFSVGDVTASLLTLDSAVCGAPSAGVSVGLPILESVLCRASFGEVSAGLESVSSGDWVLVESLGFGTGGGLHRVVGGFDLSADWVVIPPCIEFLLALFSD